MINNQLLVRDRPVIRVFVSSTFADLKHERDALQTKAFQKLETLCAGRGFQFQAIDLRWGVSSEASLDHRTMRICFEELRRSQEISPQPNFLILLGNRYGWRPLPEEISMAEFEKLVAASGNAQAEATLRAWYRRDDNNVPPVFILQSRIGNPTSGRDAAGNDLPAWIDVQNVLWSIINQAFSPDQLARRFEQPATLDGPLPVMVRFQASATEQEVWRGALAVPNAREHVVAFFRELDKDTQGTEFVDADQTPLHDLKARLEQHLAETNIIRAKNVRLHSTDHLQDLCDRVYAALEPIILRQIDEYGSTTTLQRETAEHARFGAERAPASFIGRKDKLDAIEAYLRNDSHQPLVIHGESGCGKTALMAKASQDAAKWEPIVRYLGVTPGASDVRSLLSSLCQELRQRQPRQDELPADVRDLTKELRAQFDAAEQPLVLFLDAVDQLSDADNGRALDWIPFGPLPAQVKLIVSCLSDRKLDDPAGEPFAALKKRGFAEQNYLNLDALAPDEAQTLVFDRWLPEARRQLNPEQRQRIQDRLKTDACRQPLYLKILFEEARLWRSYDPTPQLGENVGDLLNALFKRLEDPANHGPTVEAALGYIASARRGLTETEILEVLYKEREYEDSPFKNFLDEMARKHDLPKSPPRIPIAIWSRLRFDLSFYLTEHAAPGGTVLNVYHRQVAEYVRGHFLATPLQRFKCHERLAAFFGQTDYSPTNVRKVDELPWQRLEVVREACDGNLSAQLPTACDRLEQLFEDIFFLEAKTQVGLAFELAREFTQCVEILPKNRPQRRILKLLDEALHRDIHFIARHSKDYPQGLFQCLWNSAWWYDTPEAAKHYDLKKHIGKGLLPWELSLNERLSSLLERWRTQRVQGAADFTWLRSHRPPAVQLGTAQKAVLRGHEDHVWSVAWSGDGRKIVSGSEDGTIRVWDRISSEELLCIHTVCPTSVATTRDGRRIVCRLFESISVWDGLTGNELLRIRGHDSDDFVRSVALSEDERRIVSGSDKSVRVWDGITGEALLCMLGHEARVNCVAYSPVGHCIVSCADDNTVRIWDGLNGNELLCICGHEGSVTTVAWSRDGRRLVTGSVDQTVRVWDATTGQELLCIREQGYCADSVAWCGDNRHIAIGCNDATVRVWDTAKNEEIRCLRSHEGKVLSVAWSGDGRHIVSGSKDHTVRVWAVSGDLGLLAVRGHESNIEYIRLSDDGRHIFSQSDVDYTVRVWDGISGNELFCLRGHNGSVNNVALSCDGHRIASGSHEYIIQVWDATTGQELCSLRGHVREISCLVCSGNGQRIVSGSQDRTIRLWDAVTGYEIQCLRGHEDWIFSVALSGDGKLIASGSRDNTVRVWNATTGKELFCLRGHNDIVHCVAWSSDGLRIASGSGDNTVRVWSSATGKELFCLRGHDNIVRCVAWSGDGRRIASGGDDNAIRVWEADTGQEVLCLRGHEGSVDCLTWSSDGRRIASGAGDNAIRVWDAVTGQEVQCLRGPEFSVSILTWSGDDQRILSGSFYDTARVWDAVTGHEIFRLPASKMFFRCVTWSADCGLIFGSAEEYSVRIWEVATAEELLRIRGHGGYVNCVAWSGDSRHIASGSDDETARIWEALTGQMVLCLCGHERGVKGVSWSEDGRRIVSTDNSPAWRVWDTTTGECLESHEGEAPGNASESKGLRLAAIASTLETVIQESTSQHAIAWLAYSLTPIARFPSGRAWAGCLGNSLSLITLEGDERTVMLQWGELQDS